MIKTKKQAEALKTLLTTHSSAVSISDIKSIDARKPDYSEGRYELILTPSDETNIDWLVDNLNKSLSDVFCLGCISHEGEIIIY
jgi:hypothetical protein